jgi:hypothetical protein
MSSAVAEATKCLRQPLVVAGQAAKAGHPGDAASNHPPSWQQDKALLGLRKFHHFQPYALCSGITGWPLAAVSLVNKRHLHRLACHLLHLSGQIPHLGAVLLVGSSDAQGQQVPQGIHRPGLSSFRGYQPVRRLRARSALGLRARKASTTNR